MVSPIIVYTYLNILDVIFILEAQNFFSFGTHVYNIFALYHTLLLNYY